MLFVFFIIAPWCLNAAAAALLQMLDLGERLIKAGVLYADDTPVDQMREVSTARGVVLHFIAALLRSTFCICMEV
jgi:hypothetical protein